MTTIRKINTVKAVADDSDFRRPDSEIEDQNDNRDAPDADEEGQRLDAVAEESDAHRWNFPEKEGAGATEEQLLYLLYWYGTST